MFGVWEHLMGVAVWGQAVPWVCSAKHYWYHKSTFAAYLCAANQEPF